MPKSIKFIESKVLSHTNWGADRTVLLQLYRSLIRSKLDYGSIVYGSARKSYLMELDTVHHKGLRLALGALRTSPVESLYVEAEEPSLYLRREKLALQYATRLAAGPSNPAFKVTFICNAISCLLCKLTTIKAIEMKLHTVVKHNKTMCHAQEP